VQTSPLSDFGGSKLNVVSYIGPQADRAKRSPNPKFDFIFCLVLKKKFMKNASPNLDSRIAELANDVQGLLLVAKRLTNERSKGAYSSAFKGQGIEFEEVREYVPGDEIRSIDWKVTARSGKPHVKSFREERELSVLIVCDLSASTITGTKGVLRRTLINQAASILTILAMNSRDRVGLVTFTDQIEKYLRPERKRSSHIRILTELVQSPLNVVGKGTDFPKVVSFLRGVLKRKTTVFILSDFTPNPFKLPNAEQLKSELGVLARRHDLVLCPIEDPTNLDFPDSGLWRLGSPETGESFVVDLGVKELREKLIELERNSRLELYDSIIKSGCDLLKLSTRGSISQSLREFFDRRGHSPRRGGSPSRGTRLATEIAR